MTRPPIPEYEKLLADPALVGFGVAPQLVRALVEYVKQLERDAKQAEELFAEREKQLRDAEARGMEEAAAHFDRLVAELGHPECGTCENMRESADECRALAAAKRGGG